MSRKPRSHSTFPLAALALLLAATAAQAQFGGFPLLPPFLEDRDPATYDILRNPIPVPLSIVKLADEGQKVKQGQVVGELRYVVPAGEGGWQLGRDISQQQIKFLEAKAAYDSSVHDLQRAEIELREYDQGLAPLEAQRLESQLKLHEAETALAEEKLAAAREANIGPQIALKQLEFELLRAQLQKAESLARLNVFNRYTQPRRVHELQATLAEARNSSELLKQKYAVQDEALTALRNRQNQKIELIAPRDGTVRRIVPFDSNLQQPVTVGANEPILAIVDPDSHTQPPTPSDTRQSSGTTSTPMPPPAPPRPTTPDQSSNTAPTPMPPPAPPRPTDPNSPTSP